MTTKGIDKLEELTSLLVKELRRLREENHKLKVEKESLQRELHRNLNQEKTIKQDLINSSYQVKKLEKYFQQNELDKNQIRSKIQNLLQQIENAEFS